MKSRWMGWIGTLVVLVIAATCIRLGFWQFDRLEEKRALNADIGERSKLSAVALAGPVADTTGLIFRQVTVRGEFDDGGTIVLAGRSHRGLPGVHLFSPLRIAGTDHAVLVNRGWVPSPDAATIDIAAFDARGEVAIHGLAMAFPDIEDDVARRASASAGSGRSGAGVADPGDRRVTWYHLDRAAIAAQYPGALADFYVQALPAGEPQGLPVALPIPELDEGPHLSYALQWFSFATIFVIGWIVILLRRGTGLVIDAAPAPPRDRGTPVHR